jgi:hypothetical protein
MAALREVIEGKGLFCALYSDRASHFFETPRAGEPVDPRRLTQVGRALRELGIQMIPAYSPQARGRSERNFQTWQGRLPQELRRAGIKTLEEANRFLRQHYLAEFNRRFTVRAAEPGRAFLSARGRDLERIFTIQQERTVGQDNTVRLGDRVLQIEKTRWRATLAGCRVLVGEHLNGELTIYYGPHRLGHYSAEGIPLPQNSKPGPGAVEMTRPGKPGKVKEQTFPPFPPRLEIPPRTRDSHISTAPAAGFSR